MDAGALGRSEGAAAAVPDNKMLVVARGELKEDVVTSA